MRLWATFFVLAAAFNFLVGLPMLVAPAALMSGVGQAVPDDLLTVRLAGSLITLLGIGYVMAARDPVGNRGILWLGVIGKAPIPALVLIEGGLAAIGTTSFALSLVDLLCAALFLTYLLTHPRKTPAAA